MIIERSFRAIWVAALALTVLADSAGRGLAADGFDGYGPPPTAVPGGSIPPVSPGIGTGPLMPPATPAAGTMGVASPNAALPPSGDSAAASRQIRGPILDVRVVGNKAIREAEIRRHIKSHKDRPYDAQLVQEDLRRLFATRKFQNVRVQRKIVPQGVYLTFEVLERPTVREILFIGNKYISDKRLLKESGLTEGEALNIYTLQEARRKIEEHYHSKGYVKTRVTIQEGDRPGDRRAVFRVDEGPIERIWSVQFVGNDPHLVSDARLKTLVKSKPGFLKYLFHGKVDFSVVDEDIQTLTAYYRNLGYFRAKISRELEYDSSGQWLTLTFVIDEGPRYKVRSVAILGNQVFPTESLKEQLALKAGEFFNMPKMQKDERTLSDLYGGNGYIYADVKASPRFLEDPPGQLDLVYEIKEGEMFRVGEINIQIAGEYPHTRKSVVLNRLSFRPGDIIDTRKVHDSERRIKASQLFVTNPSEGAPPQIIIPPPELEDAAAMARRQEAGGSRGQGP